MWECPSCGLSAADGVVVCPGCGFLKKSYPKLSGAAGEFTLRTSLVFGSRNLAQLVGDDAVYAAERQFEIRPDGERWVVCACGPTKNATSLNDGEVMESSLELKDGDVICVSSRKDPSVKKAEIRISLNT